MTEQEYLRRRLELERLIEDARERLASANLRLLALRDDRVRLLVSHARRTAPAQPAT